MPETERTEPQAAVKPPAHWTENAPAPARVKINLPPDPRAARAIYLDAYCADLPPEAVARMPATNDWSTLEANERHIRRVVVARVRKALPPAPIAHARFLITCRAGAFLGKVQGVKFSNGRGETDSEIIATALRNQGYSVLDRALITEARDQTAADAAKQ